MIVVNVLFETPPPARGRKERLPRQSVEPATPDFDRIGGAGFETEGSAPGVSESEQGQVGAPVLQDWSWQMRKHASADRGHRQGLHLVPISDAMHVRLETAVLAHIGSLLKEMYDSALTEPVPERFVALLRQMDSEAATTDAPPAVAGHAEPK